MKVNLVKKKVAIIQSNYIPWKGYFDIMNSVDEFVLYDDAQYTKRDWRNRNLIKCKEGSLWLTIPVEVKGRYSQKIKDVKVVDKQWAKKHWNSIKNNYSKSACYKEYKDCFEDLYLSCSEEYLSEINYKFLTVINKLLGIDTKLTWSADYTYSENKTQKLVDICNGANADVYVSGPSARGYVEEKLFQSNNIDLMWMRYDSYPVYQQLYPPFLHSVSILDLLFSVGSKSMDYVSKCSKKVID